MRRRIVIMAVFASAGLFVLWAGRAHSFLVAHYQQMRSSVLVDRDGTIIQVQQNTRGNYNRWVSEVPENLETQLLAHEDKFFYWHFGINPVSIFENILAYIGMGERSGASTITQQLVKILLGNENERTVKNKLVELAYAVALELTTTKPTILLMYSNVAYFGNHAQGILEASRVYFNTAPELLSRDQIALLVNTLSNPRRNNPAMVNASAREHVKTVTYSTDVAFELNSFIKNQGECRTTIDSALTDKIRLIVATVLQELRVKNARHAGVVALSFPNNELISMVGSPDPSSTIAENQINMSREPRAIGSTIKPFIYVKAFEKGLRPYTIISDREYKYITELGLPLYPKNFDFKYHGDVTLHYALSNSLNVPAVKTLEFVGLESFYTFLLQDLGFTPIQNLRQYQLGIALGALEMSLFDLAHYFTIFSNRGILKNVSVANDSSCVQDAQFLPSRKKIVDERSVELINAILSDRRTGIEQFGIKSELNLPYKNYALKTGTSREYRDSWVVGYTPDFLVAVWVGNADASPTEGLSGQKGAGVIWAKVMDLLYNSSYNKNTPFNNRDIVSYRINGASELGLASDRVSAIRTFLSDQDTAVLLAPHEGDTFLLSETTSIPLKAKESVLWLINNKIVGEGIEYVFAPQKSGIYTIEARGKRISNSITIAVQ